ncbi:uncharacterized protein V6R79_000940 [Siganus canaliculatus]
MAPSGEKPRSFLLEASLLYTETCPELSRFLMQHHVTSSASRKHKPSDLAQNTSLCPYCFQWLKPDNHHVRLGPKQHPTARLQRVLRRKARGQRLTLMQRKMLVRFQKSSSVLMATCHTCNTTTRHKGMNRDFLTTLTKTHGTPGSMSKHKTPQSTNRASMATPKTPGKEKTPVHTPRSSTSSSTSGSSSSSTKSSSKPKNWVVQRLSKILMRDDAQGSKKGGLKDFLSSL